MPFFMPCIRRLASLARSAMVAMLITSHASGQDRYAAQRAEMVEEIARLAAQTSPETGRSAFERRVMDAMKRVPRHRLVPPDEESRAYRDRPLAIGLGQTISQPFIVALMTDLAQVKPGDKVLEVGTGSGYQAAVLAELGAEVYTIEILEPLGREAAKRLAALGYRAILARIGDGYRGWPEAAPFDAIVVTAAAPEVPAALVQQLKPGGRLVIPVGEAHGAQTLYLIEKQADGRVSKRAVLAVRFVPLTGEAQKPAR